MMSYTTKSIDGAKVKQKLSKYVNVPDILQTNVRFKVKILTQTTLHSCCS